MERRIDLDRARREAKRRVKESGGDLKLANAQRAVARELGEASWPRLVRRVEAEAVAREDRARQLVDEATNGRRDHAKALLALDPELGREGLDAALVLGEADPAARATGCRCSTPATPRSSAASARTGWSSARGRCSTRAPTRTRAGSTPSSARWARSTAPPASRTSRA